LRYLGEEYLRKLDQADDDRLLQVTGARDFSGMLRSIDYMQ